MPAQVSLNQKSNYGEIEIGSAVAAASSCWCTKGGATAEEGFFNTVGGVLSGVGGSMSETATAALRKQLILVLLVQRQRLNYNLVQY